MYARGRRAAAAAAEPDRSDPPGRFSVHFVFSRPSRPAKRSSTARYHKDGILRSDTAVLFGRRVYTRLGGSGR